MLLKSFVLFPQCLQFCQINHTLMSTAYTLGKGEAKMFDNVRLVSDTLEIKTKEPKLESTYLLFSDCIVSLFINEGH